MTDVYKELTEQANQFRQWSEKERQNVATDICAARRESYLLGVAHGIESARDLSLRWRVDEDAAG